MHYYQHRTGGSGMYERVPDMPSVYALATHDLKFIKLGFSTYLKQRIRNIQSACPFEIFLWLMIKTPEPREVEADLHKLMRHCRLRGEWFCPSTEDLDVLQKYFAMTNQNLRNVRSDEMAVA